MVTNILYLAAVLAAFNVLLTHAQGEAATTISVNPNVNEVYLSDGNSYQLNCSSTTKDIGSVSDIHLTWLHPDGASAPVATKSFFQKEGVATHVSNIVIQNFSSSKDAGKYTCAVMRSNIEEVKRSVTVKGINETKNAPQYFFGNSTATLKCNVSIPNETVSGPVWYKVTPTDSAGKLVDELEKPARFNRTQSNTTLIISDANRDDAGKYFARFKIGVDQNYDCIVELKATPFVMNFDKSKNLIQEDDLKLQCKVKGYPKARVTWSKDDVELNISKDDRMSQAPSDDGYENAVLKIKEVKFSDAGVYKCEAMSAELNESAAETIVVRVKDKLAALWPFLGIVGEVIILCTIIFIYEKRRNKQAEQAENDAQEADTAEKKGNVRNRRHQK